MFKAAASTPAFGFFSARSSKEQVSAKYSPKESQRKWASFSNCCTCFGAEPPAPVSYMPPPASIGTTESIFAEVPNSRIGHKSVR